MSNKKEIVDEELDKVSGGDIKDGGFAYLDRYYIYLAKDKGWGVNELVDYFTEAWMRNCLFKTSYTDGKSSDYDAAVSYIRNNFDKQ